MNSNISSVLLAGFALLCVGVGVHFSLDWDRQLESQLSEEFPFEINAHCRRRNGIHFSHECATVDGIQFSFGETVAGSVHLASVKLGNWESARGILKIIKEESTNAQRRNELLRREVALLKFMQPFQVWAFGHALIDDLPQPYVLAEFLTGFVDFVGFSSETSAPFSPQSLEIENIHQCALLAKLQLDKLHSADWVHGDLKPDNIMVRSSVSRSGNLYVDLRIIDFELAVPMARNRALECEGTFEYWSPVHACLCDDQLFAASIDGSLQSPAERMMSCRSLAQTGALDDRRVMDTFPLGVSLLKLALLRNTGLMEAVINAGIDFPRCFCDFEESELPKPKSSCYVRMAQCIAAGIVDESRVTHELVAVIKPLIDLRQSVNSPKRTSQLASTNNMNSRNLHRAVVLDE